MQIVIRKIEPEDAEILSVLAKQTFYDTFTGSCTEEDMQGFLEEYFNVSRIKNELEDSNSFNYFALVNGVPIAYMRFKEDYESFPYMKRWKAIELKRLYIQKEFQGKGIAQQMMDLFIGYAIGNNYEAAWLSVWEYNFRAQKFYSKYGFEDSGYGHDFPIGNTPQIDRWYLRKL
jgi:ribosomal protein S18 acetylase RimI-like enzyme